MLSGRRTHWLGAPSDNPLHPLDWYYLLITECSAEIIITSWSMGPALKQGVPGPSWRAVPSCRCPRRDSPRKNQTSGDRIDRTHRRSSLPLLAARCYGLVSHHDTCLPAALEARDHEKTIPVRMAGTCLPSTGILQVGATPQRKISERVPRDNPTHRGSP